MAHKTDYRFYIQPYPHGTTTYQKEDIEQKYDCDYMRMTGLSFDGDVKNTYEEDYSEMSGKRVFIPPKSELAFSSTECKLKLFFKGGDVKARVQQFCNDYMGQKIEWSDTFRGRYATLLMTKAPNIESEKLYGPVPIMVVEFTFTNILGYTYESSKIISLL